MASFWKWMIACLSSLPRQSANSVCKDTQVETASYKNCYAFSYVSVAVFTRFLWRSMYTYGISFTVFSTCFLPLACCQGVGFRYGDERTG